MRYAVEGQQRNRGGTEEEQRRGRGAVSSVPRNFIPGRDGIESKSLDPGIFRDGNSLKL